MTPLSADASVAFVLWPRRCMAGLDATIVVPRGADTVMFDIRVDTHDFACYAMALKDLATNQVMWRSSRVASRVTRGQASVTVEVPARVLRRRHYSVDLTGRNASSGAELISSSPFQVFSQ